MCSLLTWCRLYEPLINFVLAGLSFLLAIIAIAISISSANRQTKLDVWDKRYEIYAPFVEMVNKMERLCGYSEGKSGLALKKLAILMFYVPQVNEEYELSQKTVNLEQEIIEAGLEGQALIEKNMQLNSLNNEKFRLDIIRYAKYDDIFSRADLLFPHKISYAIKAFWKVYGNIILGNTLYEAGTEYSDMLLSLKNVLIENNMHDIISQMNRIMKVD